MKMLKVFIVLSAIVSLWCSGVFASELEVVEQDKPAAALEQPRKGVPWDASGVQAAQSQTAPESASTIEPKTEEATLVRATDEKFPEPKGEKTTKMPVPVQRETVDEPTRYTLGPEDIVEIIVRRHPEFSGIYPINAEGKIQYKFVGDFEVKGLAKTELKEKVAKMLGKFIIDPDVEVTILEYRSKVIYVIGEVGAPGKYYMKADKVSLREAIVQAGLPTLAAAMRRTQLVRPTKVGKPMEKTIDLYALLYEGKLILDQDMLPGDVVHVPATLFSKIMRILNPVAETISSTDTIRRTGTGGF